MSVVLLLLNAHGRSEGNEDVHGYLRTVSAEAPTGAKALRQWL